MAARAAGRCRRGFARAARAPPHPGHDARLRVPRADREARAWKAKKGWTFPGTRRTAATSTTTSASPSTSRSSRRSTTTARGPSTSAGSAHPFDFEQPVEMPGTSCFLRHGDRVFHTYSLVRARRRDDRRLVLLPRPHRPRPPGGLGGARRAGLTARAPRSRTSPVDPANGWRHCPLYTGSWRHPRSGYILPYGNMSPDDGLRGARRTHPPADPRSAPRRRALGQRPRRPAGRSASPASPSTSRCCARPGSSPCAAQGKQRLYALRSEPLAEVDAWLEPYREFWSSRLDALEHHLEENP